MHGGEATENGEAAPARVLPILYKKKVFSLKKTRELEKELQKALDSNKQHVENRKAMHDKIKARHDEFVRRLETHLAQFQSENVTKIVLKEDMFPQWSPQKKETEPGTAISTGKQVEEDSIERLNEWKATMESYVKAEEDAARIISDWFTCLDKAKNEGEPDPKVVEYTYIKWIDSLEDLVDPFNVLSYFIFILLCFVNVFIFYQPEDVRQCVHEPGKCIMSGLIFFVAKLSNSYLAFHNMTIQDVIREMPATTAALNSSVK